MKLTIKSIFTFLRRFIAPWTIAVAGLAIAYAVFYMIVVQVSFDLRFDRNFENADRIFLYSRTGVGVPWGRSTGATLAEVGVIVSRYPEIQNFTHVRSMNIRFRITDDRTGEERFFDENMTTVNTEFIEMFQPRILLGDINRAIASTDSRYAILSESTARRMFGNENPIGEIIHYTTSWWHPNVLEFIIVAIFADFPDNSSLKNGVYLLANHHLGGVTYFEIDPRNRNRLLQRMNEEQVMARLVGVEEDDWRIELTPLPRVHLSAEGEGNPVLIILLLTVGILLLVVSYINFLNFSVALTPVRMKNINLRKILGESTFMLRLSVVLETVFLSLVAFLLSILLIRFMNVGALADFFRADLALSENLGLLFFVGVISILSGFLAGLYPAIYTTAFNPAMALSGSFSHTSHNKWLRNILTGLQFTVAIFLITTMLFINRQYNFMRNADWGIQTENVIYAQLHWTDRYFVNDFITELSRNPHIWDITASERLPGQERGQSWGNIPFGGTVINDLEIWHVKPNFFDFFGATIIQGEGFREHDRDRMILNRAFFREHNIVEEVNTNFGDLRGNELVGIVEDFNFQSLHRNISPVAFILINEENHHLNYVFVKTDGANTCQVIDFIRDTRRRFTQEPAEIRLLTETIQALYQAEHNTARLVSICGIIAIIVAITGLYGLVLFNARAKRKNIAIRRIHGASIVEILLMLNKNLFIQFAVSCLVAFPLAYYAVHRWLENFAYQTPMYWWVFALGGFIVLIVSLLTVSWESYKAASANPVKGIKSV